MGVFGSSAWSAAKSASQTVVRTASMASLGGLTLFSACTKTAFKSKSATPVPSATTAPVSKRAPDELDANGTNKPRTSPNEMDSNGRAKDATVPANANGEPLPGTTITQPNGTTTTTYPDGTTVTKSPDGTTTTKNPDGTTTTVTPDGTKTTTTPNGTTSTTKPDGTTTTTKPNSPTVVTGPNGEKLPDGNPDQTTPGQTTPGQTTPGQTTPVQTNPGQTMPVQQQPPPNSTTPPVSSPSTGCAQGGVTPVAGISGGGAPHSYVDYSGDVKAPNAGTKADVYVGYASLKSSVCDVFIVGRNGAPIVNSSSAGSLNVVTSNQIFWAMPYDAAPLRMINTNLASNGYFCTNSGGRLVLTGPQNRVIGQTSTVPAAGSRAPIALAPNTCIGRQQDIGRNPKDFWFVTFF